MGVEVRQLTAPLPLSDFHPYGDPGGPRCCRPARTGSRPAQAQKHWIQSMLNEETWIPFDVTYDVTAWSNPLLMNLDGGWSGDDRLAGVGRSCAPSPRRTWLPHGRRRPRRAPARERPEHARLRVGRPGGVPVPRRLGPAVRPRLPERIRSGDLADYDVVVLPDGFPNYALQDLGAKGKKALRQWVNDGGRLVAWQGGAVVAAKAGISTAQFSTSNSNTSGALLRVAVDDASPVADGVGDLDWVMYAGRPGDEARARRAPLRRSRRRPTTRSRRPA